MPTTSKKEKKIHADDYKLFKEIISFQTPLNLLIGEIKFYHKKLNLSKENGKVYEMSSLTKEEMKNVYYAITFAIETLNDIKQTFEYIFPNFKKIKENEKKNNMDSSS